jgi:hypothetical protein
MKEQIKLLAEQATTRKFDGTGADMGKLVLDQEKFAELIVRECMNVLAESREVRQTAYYYRNRITEHFGVKE